MGGVLAAGLDHRRTMWLEYLADELHCMPIVVDDHDGDASEREGRLRGVV